MINIYHLLTILSWIIVIISISVLCRKYLPSQKELSRKVVHIGIGPVIVLAWWFNISSTIAIITSLTITIGLILNYKVKMLPALEDIPRKSFGTIAYGVSITLLLILFWPENANAVSAGILVMAFGDGLAGLIGPQIKSPSWKIFNQRKSIAGTATMAMTSIIVLILINALSYSSLQPVRIFVISIMAVALEQISLWGIDNLTVPISVAYGSIWMLNQ